MLLLRLICLWPQRLLPALVSMIFWIVYPFARRDRRLIAANVHKVYGLPSHSSFSKLFVRQNIKAQIEIMLDTLRYALRPDDIKIVGLTDAKAKVAHIPKETGVVIIAAHIGSWDLAGHAAKMALERPFYALAKPSTLKSLTDVLGFVREKMGMSVLWTDSKSLLRDMMHHAQKGAALGFVMDQKPANRQSGHPCRFLDVAETHMVQGPALMAARKNLPVFGTYVLRIAPSTYRFFLTEVLPCNHGNTNEAAITQLMADDMTKMIRLYPEQWSWNYRRWKF